jgi:cardiolipin synthase A/B
MGFLIGGVFGFVVAFLITVLVSGPRRRLEHLVQDMAAVDEPQFIRSFGALLGSPLVHGNLVTELVNGHRIFPAMLEAIAQARRSICFETFIYWRGEMGRRFADALAQRAQAGIRVHVLLDYAGTLPMDTSLIDHMRSAGCQVVRYHPPTLLHPWRMNNRTHRKLLVVDGRIGFTGGVGIGDEWTGNAEDPRHWRDSHFQVEGPVVAQLQAAFLTNWTKAKGRIEHSEAYFPELPPVGPHLAQLFHSSPDEGSEKMRLMYLMSIAAARRTILLEQSYFVPDRLTRHALARAARRGVRVEIILPGPHIDVRVVRRASRACLGPLLKAGVRFYEYQPTNLHCKVMIVDGGWVSVGSANFDNRSFGLNDEANLNIYDREFAAQLERTFAEDLARSKPLTLRDWRRRPLRERILEAAARTLRHQL